MPRLSGPKISSNVLVCLALVVVTSNFLQTHRQSLKGLAPPRRPTKASYQISPASPEPKLNFHFRRDGQSSRLPSPCWQGQVPDSKGVFCHSKLGPSFIFCPCLTLCFSNRTRNYARIVLICPHQVEPQEKKKTPKGRAKKRITYTRRFVNVTMTGGKRKVSTSS